MKRRNMDHIKRTPLQQITFSPDRDLTPIPEDLPLLHHGRNQSQSQYQSEATVTPHPPGCVTLEEPLLINQNQHQFQNASHFLSGPTLLSRYSPYSDSASRYPVDLFVPDYNLLNLSNESHSYTSFGDQPATTGESHNRDTHSSTHGSAFPSVTSSTHGSAFPSLTSSNTTVLTTPSPHSGGYGSGSLGLLATIPPPHIDPASFMQRGYGLIDPFHPYPTSTAQPVPYQGQHGGQSGFQPGQFVPLPSSAKPQNPTDGKSKHQDQDQPPHQGGQTRQTSTDEDIIQNPPPLIIDVFKVELINAQPKEKRVTVASACMRCGSQKKKCSDNLPCAQCSNRIKKAWRRRLARNLQCANALESDLDEICSLKIGLFGFEHRLLDYAELLLWDDRSTDMFFRSYPGVRYLSYNKMTAYVNQVSDTKRITRLTTDNFLRASLKSPFAQELLEHAREVSSDLNISVAEWCKERLQVAKRILQDTSTDPLCCDTSVKDLYCLLQIILWSKHGSRDCMYIALCEHACRQIVHSVAKMTKISSRNSQTRLLGLILESEMFVWARRGHNRIWWQLAAFNNCSDDGPDALKKRVEDLRFHYGAYIGESTWRLLF